MIHFLSVKKDFVIEEDNFVLLVLNKGHKFYGQKYQFRKGVFLSVHLIFWTRNKSIIAVKSIGIICLKRLSSALVGIDF